MMYGMSTWNFLKPLGGEADLYQALDWLTEQGLGIELWLDWTAAPQRVAWENREELKRRCRGAAALSAHSRLIHHFDPAVLREEIDLCAFLGADPLVVHPRSLGLEAGTWDAEAPDGVPAAADLRRIESDLAYAAERSVHLALENGAPELLKRVLDGLASSSRSGQLGICLDTGHANLHRDRYAEPAADILQSFGGRLLHLHLSDNHGLSDEHLLPGQGSVNWAALQAGLERLGYRGKVVFELQDEDPEKAARAAVSFFQGLAGGGAAGQAPAS